MNQQTGKMIIIAGIAILAVGLFVYFFHSHMKWLGRLPGDIRVEKENFTFYFPVTTMILLSLVVSGLLWLIRKL